MKQIFLVLIMLLAIVSIATYNDSLQGSQTAKKSLDRLHILSWQPPIQYSDPPPISVSQTEQPCHLWPINSRL